MARLQNSRSSEPPIQLQEIPIGPGQRYRLGRATLNSPKSLNALSLDMIQQLLDQLSEWADDPNLVAIWLEGAGDKAFCAGGDVVQVYRAMAEYGEDENPEAIDYFSHEYRLDHLLHTFPKPVICWGHGIVMGGGMGLMPGADFRIVTEQSRLAMPEITISLFPDVGGSWFLNRMPGRTGRFVALTGAPMNASDALFAGLADRCIAHENKGEVLAAIREAPWDGSPAHNRHMLNRLLRDIAHHEAHELHLPDSQLRTHFDRINQLMDHPDIEGVVHAITGLTDSAPWLQQAAATLKKGSPAAAWVIDRQLTRARYWSLAEVFQHELVLAVNCCRLGEFREGVRALLIDKDKQPRWRYPDIESVEAEFVDAHFVNHWTDNPLSDLTSDQP